MTSRAFTVTILNDTLVESPETVVLTLSNPGNASLGTPAVATVNVTSEDVGGTVQFSSAVYSRDEGGAEATVTVLRVGGFASGVTVDVATVDGTALAGTDYTAVAGTLTFNAGQTSASFTVPLLDNGAASAGRWLGLALSAVGGGARLGTPSSAVLWIVDDDTAGFFDGFDRPGNAAIGNGWTEKFPGAFAVQNNEVVSVDTGTIDYHDAIVYRPAAEDRRDVEVGIEFRILPGQNFPQLHARVQRNTIAQPDTLSGYLLFVDGFEPSPGRAIIALQQPVTGQFECYMLAIPFPSPLQETDRYRLRFQLTGANPVTLTGIVERLNGTTWPAFASGTTIHDDATQRNPGLYCDPGFLASPISTAGAVGFAKWQSNNEVYDNFYWIALP